MGNKLSLDELVVNILMAKTRPPKEKVLNFTRFGAEAYLGYNRLIERYNSSQQVPILAIEVGFRKGL